MTDTGEFLHTLCARERELLTAAIVDRTTPDYVVIRALTALGDDPDDRLARFTAMGRQFVAELRRRVHDEGARGLLHEPPSLAERILETATEQIVQTGRRDLTMRTVSGEARIPRRTLYNLYASSENLIQMCQRRAQTIWRARFEQRVLSIECDAEQRLFVVIEVIDDWVRSDRFRGDLALRARPSFADALRDDGLREHLAEIDRFATRLAVEAKLAAPGEFGAFVATSVAGATAWFDRRAEARAASIAVVERLVAAPRRA